MDAASSRGGDARPASNPTLAPSRWVLSIAVSIVLLVLIGFRWHVQNTREIASQQLVDQQAVDAAVEDWAAVAGEQPFTVEVGVFIQSLRFANASDVEMTGYVWQRWPADAPDGLEPGVVFPEMVDTEVGLVQEYVVNDTSGPVPVEVHGWSFEGTFRQPFEYDDYPFDDKIVWLRMWPEGFAANVVLTPDLGSYTATGENDVFGIDSDIVLGNWSRDDTFFDYSRSNYNTNFGIEDYVGQQDFPELRFNVLLRRQFENAFVVNLVPLALVAGLAFAAVLTVTRNRDRAARFGFDVSGMLGMVSALFFVVLLSHIQLRQEFAGAGTTYLEYFYFVMYLVLIVVAVNTYVIAGIEPDDGPPSRPENAAMKLGYWPALLGALLVITLLAL